MIKESKFIDMLARISYELKKAILAFHSLKLSMQTIVRQLLVMGKTVPSSLRKWRIQDVQNHQKV
jgi:hypothetical protein